MVTTTICGAPLAKKSPTGEIRYCKNKATKTRSDGTPCCGKHCGSVASSDMGNCSICLCDMITGTQVKTLPCNHSFHKNCINTWSMEHNTCPCCRKSYETSSTRSRMTREQRELNDRLDRLLREVRDILEPARRMGLVAR